MTVGQNRRDLRGVSDYVAAATRSVLCGIFQARMCRWCEPSDGEPGGHSQTLVVIRRPVKLEQKWRLAYHLAGHAAVCQILHLKFAPFSLNDESLCQSLRKRGQDYLEDSVHLINHLPGGRQTWEALVIANLAGKVAEAIRLGRSVQDRRIKSKATSSDDSVVDALLHGAVIESEIMAPYGAMCARYAEVLLLQNWATVQRLAETLMSNGKISYEEVCRIMTESKVKPMGAKPVTGPASRIIFLLTNALVPPAGLELELDGRKIWIRRRRGYSSLIAEANDRPTFELTAELGIELDGTVGLEQLKTMADEICQLLSFATSNTVLWNEFTLHRDDQRRPSLKDKAGTEIFGGGTSRQALVEIRPLNLEKSLLPQVQWSIFLEQALPTYRANSVDLSLAMAYSIHSRLEKGAVEIRALLAFTGLDFVYQSWAKEQGDWANHISPKDWKGAKGLRSGIADLVSRHFPSLDKDRLEEIKEKVPELNRRSYSKGLRAMLTMLEPLTILGWPLNVAEFVPQFIKRRNQLIHCGGAELVLAELHHYQTVAQRILEQVILKRLAFPGPAKLLDRLSPTE